MKQFPISAQLLLLARKKSGLDQQPFMQKHAIKVTQATYSRWENGKVKVPAEVLLKVGAVKPVSDF